MDPQVGKLGNIDHLEPGMISVTRHPQPGHGHAADVSRGHARYNNSWNWNLHYRAAVSYITGSHAFKVGFNNAYLHHDNTTYSAPALPYSYNFTSMVPDRDHLPDRAPHGRGQRRSRHRDSSRRTSGRPAGGRSRARSASTPSRTASRSSRSPATFFGRNLNVQYDKIDNLSWNDITPKLGATYDVFGNGKTAFKVTLNKYLEGLGTTDSGGAGIGRAESDQPAAEQRRQRVWARRRPRLRPGLRSEQLRRQR